MRISDFDFELPEELIAQAPLERRDGSRLLVLGRRSGEPSHRSFRELPSLLRAGDLLVVNDARVIPARLIGRKRDSGGKVELLAFERLSRDAEGEIWKALGQASKGLKPGARLVFGELEAEVLGALGEGMYEVRLFGADVSAAMERVGRIPLPPYIRREPEAGDRERYQTVFASVPGAVAAPTAGLHFTPDLLAEIEALGVSIARVTLNVGPGTFLPVRTDLVEEHRMHEESYEVPPATAEAIARTRERGGRVIAVGTTAVRTLESAATSGGALRPGAGAARLFIYPGYEFKVVQGLVTNFHLPRSTLLLLVSAFAGKEAVLGAYRAAVRQRYRFFSYGDAMFIG